MSDDTIGTLAGVRRGSALDVIRGGREQARQQAEASFRALFEPDDPGRFALHDRFAVAAFVAALHAQPEIAAFYGERLSDAALHAAIRAAADAASGTGPYGNYPAGRLTREDQAGPVYRVADPWRETLGPRLAAALEHTHMLVLHPRDAAPAHLQALLDAGWSTTEVVTLSQLVSFLAFQIRAVVGLRVLAAHV